MDSSRKARAAGTVARAYRAGATILNVEGRVQELKGKQYASHRQVSASALAPSVRKQQLPVKIVSPAAVQHDMELVPEPWMREWVRELKLIYDDESQRVCRLVHVAWNADHKALVGWFHEVESLTTPAPMKGKYVDTDRCLWALMSDVRLMRREYEFWSRFLGL